jgi:hypothetical protein
MIGGFIARFVYILAQTHQTALIKTTKYEYVLARWIKT